MENFQITKLVSRKFKGGAVSYRHLNVEIPEYKKNKNITPPHLYSGSKQHSALSLKWRDDTAPPQFSARSLILNHTFNAFI
jgi:hypothetical protein